MLRCDCGPHRVRGSAAPLVVQDGPLRVTGTWDFKWAPGTEIRVAVQALHADFQLQMTDVVPWLEKALDAWIPRSSQNGRSLPALSWALLLGEELPAPVASDQARSDPALLRANRFIEYDVLVSFARLPVLIPETSQDKETTVNFPRSELGSYARRTEYGVPTIFLGPHETFTSQSKAGKTDFPSLLREWFESPEGAFTLIHEVGHIFGLAHEQQNPRLEGTLAWRPSEEMVAIASKRNSQNPPDLSIKDFVASEITEPWPGDIRLSDWRDPPVIHDGTANFDSVMAKPVYRCFLSDRHRHDLMDGEPLTDSNGKRVTELDCIDLEVCPVEQREFLRLDKPTPSDLEQLVCMYGRRFSVEPELVDYPQSAE